VQKGKSAREQLLREIRRLHGARKARSYPVIST